MFQLASCLSDPAAPFFNNARLRAFGRPPLAASITMNRKFQYDDGGRADAGFKGETGDCATRAIAIATQMPYQEVYDTVNYHCAKEKASKARRCQSSARTGVHMVTMRNIMYSLGWNWFPTMGIGSGCTVHVGASELPEGRLVLRLSKHYAAFVWGKLHDSHDSSRDGTRCVYGYWHKSS